MLNDFEPAFHDERNEWQMYAFDPSERQIQGTRKRELIAVGPTEERVIRTGALSARDRFWEGAEVSVRRACCALFLGVLAVTACAPAAPAGRTPAPVVPASTAPAVGNGQWSVFRSHAAEMTAGLRSTVETVEGAMAANDTDLAHDALEESASKLSAEILWIIDHPPLACFSDYYTAYTTAVGTTYDSFTEAAREPIMAAAIARRTAEATTLLDAADQALRQTAC
jgi:hypothetical protein